jgi:hypothetical protein
MAKDTKDTTTTGNGDPEAPANPVATTLEEANDAGYLGQPPDSRPNDEYTVEGVIAAAEAHAKEVPQSVEDEGSGTPASSSKSTSSKSSS